MIPTAQLALLYLALGGTTPTESCPKPESALYQAYKVLDSWVVVDRCTYKAKALHLPDELKAENLAVSRDGKMAVFTAFSSEAHNTLLYAWAPAGPGQPTSIGDTRGYHSEPTFSLDGTWVYFAHNPNAEGRPMAHGMRAYAQIYRVRLNGTELQALTSNDGCHFAPSDSRSGITYVHTACHNQTREITDLSKEIGQAPPLQVSNQSIDHIFTTDSGDTVLYSAKRNLSIAIYALNTATRQTQEILTLPLSPSSPQATFGRTVNEIVFVDRGELWRYSTKTAEKAKVWSLTNVDQ